MGIEGDGKGGDIVEEALPGSAYGAGIEDVGGKVGPIVDAGQDGIYPLVLAKFLQVELHPVYGST